MRIISIVNQKGGCGKTTTSVNLAAVLASRGRRVMLVDLDPQSHCAAALGVPEAEIEYSTIDLLLDPPAEAMTPSRIAARTWEVAFGLRLLPSTVRLARAEAPGGGLLEAGDRDRRLRRGLEAFGDALDYCIVDCPPTIGMLTFNALRAADEIVVPVETGFLAARGAQRQLATLRAMAGRIGRSMKVRMVPNLLHPERSLDRELLDGLRARFQTGVAPDPIRDHIEIREATAFGRAVVEHAPDSEAAEDYRRLANWIETGTPTLVEPPAIAETTGSAGPADQTSPLDPAAGVRSVEVSARAAELVRRMTPGRGGPPRPVPVPEPRVHEGRVRIVAPVAVGSGVRIVGDLNHWQADGVPLAPLPGLSPDLIGIDVPLLGPLRYRLMIDGRPMLDPANPRVAEGPDGRPANLVPLPGNLATEGDAAGMSRAGFSGDR
ncbi:MAG: AAA family ATPase [Planctomycetota bacterium]|nr:AAA family ATPase [Planctomycetota bacterium]